MRTIIAGSRSIEDYNKLLTAISKSGFKITHVVCGGAKGVDTLGLWFAKQNNIPYTMFYPDWNKYGKKAGFIRNQEMAQHADALIALWDGSSKGTNHMINIALDQELEVYVENV